MSQKTSEKTTTPLTTKVKKGVGFYQINLAQFKKIANSGLGPFAMAAYLVLAGGVDSTKNTRRASTHGVKSIRIRTAILEGRIEKAVESLVKNGFLELPPETENEGQHQLWKKEQVQYILDPQSRCDTFISQDFLQISEDDERGKPQFKRETLGYLIYQTEGDGDDIPKLNAIVDALLVYVCLHKEQDFACFGGVNPQIAHGRFIPSDADEDGEGSLAAQAVAGVEGWTWFQQKRTDEMVYSPEFISQTLGDVQAWGNSPTLEIRFKHAITQLENAGLIYRSVVLWKANPLGLTDGYPAEPLVTLKVGNRRDRKRELDIQVAVTNTLLKTQCIERTEVFDKKGDPACNWINKDYFDFIVPNNKVKGITLLTQLRVRRWGGTERNMTALNFDADRTLNWRARLKEMTDAA